MASLSSHLTSLSIGYVAVSKCEKLLSIITSKGIIIRFSLWAGQPRPLPLPDKTPRAYESWTVISQTDAKFENPRTKYKKWKNLLPKMHVSYEKCIRLMK
jgi:hypothetical protein